MSKELEILIRPESSILAKYKETDYKIESVLSEFIDNSTQSYFDHRIDLNNIGVNRCIINIEIYKEYIIIKDNAFGMEEKDFRRALKLDSPPEDTSGRNEKGMGLKTAATYLGSWWSIRTSRYGASEQYSAEMDVDYIQKNAPEHITARIYDVTPEEHYTTVEIRKLNQKITPAKIKKVMITLAEMYARDILNNDVTIIINKTPLRYDPPEIRTDEFGQEYLKQISDSLTYEGKVYSYSGWVGIRKKGNTASSGLTLLHKGRAVITNYRPKDLLGAANSFPYQRIIGEIDMGDEWPISHTKDAFVWDGGLEDEFISRLKSKAEMGIGDLILISTKLRNDDVSKEKKEKTKKKTESNLKALKDVKIDNAAIMAEPEKVDYVPEVKSKPSDKTVHVDFQGTSYEFEINEGTSLEKDWIKIEKTEQDNYYIIHVDYDIPYFHSVFAKNVKDNTSYEFLEKLVISIALSYITSKSSGCKDGHMLINMLNAIIANVE